MQYFLYRGISVIEDNQNNGELRLKGMRLSIEAQCGDSWAVCGEGIECGSSRYNAVIAHQFDSDISNTSYISTTRSFHVAVKFATSNNLEEGYVYTLDPEKFKEYGVIIYERKEGSVANEKEITLATLNLRAIPSEVIVNKMLIKPTSL